MVLDAQGAVITNADIVAIRVETGIRYHSATDSAGRFAVDLLPPGQYSARAEAEGMSPEISPVIRVEIGAAALLTFKLKVAGPKETITVSDAPRMMEMDPSELSALVDERASQDLPLNGRRFTDLLLLMPGVTQDPRGLTSESNGDLSYGGIRGYNTSFLIDGGDDNNGFYAQAAGRYRAPYQFSNEVVQEFRVSSSGYGSESGRAGGAVVNVVTKSGTNQWHGSSFYFLRDSALGGAAPAFVGFNPNDVQHQFGGTIGGPIQRSKTFFFAGYDQHIFYIPAVVQFDNGSSVVVPQLGVYPTPGDYEICNPAIGGMACDQVLVFASAAQLSTMGGDVSRAVAGEYGIREAGPGADRASVSYGAAEHIPVLRDEQRLYRSGESDYELFDQREWRRGSEDGKRVAEFGERHYAAADQPFACAVLARSGTVVSQYDRGADQHLQLDAGFRAIVDTAATDAGAPAACGGDFEPEPRAKRMEDRRRRDDDLGLQLLPVTLWR